MKILTPAEMRDLDISAVENLGIPEIVLMENASSAALHVLSQHFLSLNEKGLIICGSGNNGGDGFALARKLYSLSLPVTVLFYGSREKLSSASLQNLICLEKIGISFYSDPEGDLLRKQLEETDYIVDALFGTGLNRPVQGKYAQVIRMINNSGKKILSLDIPSGVNGVNGKIENHAVRANATVTFGNPKKGNLLYPGYAQNGQLFCSRISFPPEYYENSLYQSEVNLPPPLPHRNPEGYKNSFGKVLLIGGGGSYFGAPALAAQAIFRSGGGFVTAVLPEELVSSFSILCPEAVVSPQKSDENNCLTQKSASEILELSTQHTSVIIGPGITRTSGVTSLLEQLIPEIPVPLILDADGLHALAGKPELTRNRRSSTILTPHKGEQRALSGDGKIEEPLENYYNAITVYKGPHSAIKMPDGREYINLTGNSALGTAGSGDALTGIIAGLISALGAEDAVRTGVLIHGLTAEIASREIPEDSFTASEILNYLPKAIDFYRKNHSSLSKTCYNTIYTLS